MSELELPFKIDAKVTQTFGNKLYRNGKDIYAQWGLKGHNGVDYGLPNGTSVYAPHFGIIKEVFYDKPGYGWYVKIENDKEGSVLAHLQKSIVRIGNYVNQGDLVAYSNNTGFSTGPHLHWGYYRKPRNRNNGYIGYIDQTPYLNDSQTIKQFLISVGYKYPKSHLDVVKALYQSDLKLKSGKYISKKDCKKQYKSKIKKLKKEKEKNKKKYKEKVETITEEVKSSKRKVKEIEKSMAYKIAMTTIKILKPFKGKGEN